MFAFWDDALNQYYTSQHHRDPALNQCIFCRMEALWALHEYKGNREMLPPTLCVTAHFTTIQIWLPKLPHYLNGDLLIPQKIRREDIKKDMFSKARDYQHWGEDGY